ncbi:MAG TPA: ATP-binding protein [Alphaproteobacteria bacterium]|nr:ATP-binding protein [Alphaproteobacteria bacterium]
MNASASPPLASSGVVNDGTGDGDAPRIPAFRLLINAPTLGPDATSGEVYDLLVARPEIPCIPIIDHDWIVGAVDRVSLLNRFSRHLMRDYYFGRPVSLVLDPEPLVIDADTPISVLTERISHEKPQALTAGFIITRDGRYAGVGTALDMMRASVEEAQLRAAELSRLQKVAEEANRSKTLFLANMSHEFRTPLNAIIGFGEVLGSQRFGPLNARQAEYIEDIRNSGVHLLALVNDILEMSKAEAGKLELHENCVLLEELAINCLRTVRQRAQEAGLELSLELPDKHVELWCDPVKLRQIIVNLLSNAVKFTNPGGKVAVEARLLVDGGLEIAVADNGIGMSPEQIPLALQAFVQIDNSSNRSHQGTGLGLPLCKQLTELHGGELIVESALGKGSRMRVRLPVERIKVAGPRASDDASFESLLAVAYAGLRILEAEEPRIQ